MCNDGVENDHTDTCDGEIDDADELDDATGINTNLLSMMMMMMKAVIFGTHTLLITHTQSGIR